MMPDAYGAELLAALLAGVGTAGVGLTAILWRVSRWHTRVEDRLEAVEAAVLEQTREAKQRSGQLHGRIDGHDEDIAQLRVDVAVLDASSVRGSAA